MRMGRCIQNADYTRERERETDGGREGDGGERRGERREREGGGERERERHTREPQLLHLGQPQPRSGAFLAGNSFSTRPRYPQAVKDTVLITSWMPRPVPLKIADARN